MNLPFTLVKDGKPTYFPEEQMIKLANNDGFDTTDDYFKWFNRDWRGSLIHWTDLKY